MSIQQPTNNQDAKWPYFVRSLPFLFFPLALLYFIFFFEIERRLGIGTGKLFYSGALLLAFAWFFDLLRFFRRGKTSLYVSASPINMAMKWSAALMVIAAAAQLIFHR